MHNFKFHHYSDGSVCIYSGHNTAVLTIDPSKYGCSYPDKVIINHFAGHGTAVESLVEAGVVLPPSSWVNGEHNFMFPICELTPAAKKAAGVPL